MQMFNRRVDIKLLNTFNPNTSPNPNPNLIPKPIPDLIPNTNPTPNPSPAFEWLTAKNKRQKDNNSSKTRPLSLYLKS